MKDMDLLNLKLLPVDHIALKDYEYVVGVEKKNKLLENTIVGIITVGVLVLTYYIIKDESSRDKQ
jgi:hypothetical protein